MGRKPKTNRVPRTRAGGEWTEAAFWGFLRSALRQAARRWPPVVRQVWDQNRRDNQSDNKRLKWEFYCSGCGEWFPRKELQTEHTEPCGSLRNWDEFRDFAKRLFVESDGLTLHCEDCHKAKTDEEKKSREAT